MELINSNNKLKENFATLAEVIRHKLAHNNEMKTFLSYLLLHHKQHNLPNLAIAKYFYQLIQDIFTPLTLKSRQVALIIQLFRFRCYGGSLKAPVYGNYIVDLVISLLNTIHDMENIGIIMASLTPLEHACVLCRVGFDHERKNV